MAGYCTSCGGTGFRKPTAQKKVDAFNTETSLSPDRGYHGDTKRGANLGRPRRAKESDQRIYLRKIRLDSGGYDSGGAYWGHGGALYQAFTDDGALYRTYRDYSRNPRESIKAEIATHFPGARFCR